MLDMGNLVGVIRLSFQVTEESLSIHYGSPSLDGQNLNFIVEYLYIKMAVDNKISDFRQNFVSVTAIIADKANSHGSHLPPVVIINLSHRDVEFISNPGDNRFQYLPLTLER